MMKIRISSCNWTCHRITMHHVICRCFRHQFNLENNLLWPTYCGSISHFKASALHVRTHFLSISHARYDGPFWKLQNHVLWQASSTYVLGSTDNLPISCRIPAIRNSSWSCGKLCQSFLTQFTSYVCISSLILDEHLHFALDDFTIFSLIVPSLTIFTFLLTFVHRLEIWYLLICASQVTMGTTSNWSHCLVFTGCTVVR